MNDLSERLREILKKMKKSNNGTDDNDDELFLWYG